MLKQLSLIFVFFNYSFLSITFAQCVDVSIASTSALSSASICRSTPIILTAIPSVSTINPQYTWIVDNDTVSTGDSSINLLANGQRVELLMTSSTTCLPGDQNSADASLQITVAELSSSITVSDVVCSTSNANINITSSGGTPSYVYELEGFGQSGDFFESIPLGAYTLVTEDLNGCRDTSTVIASSDDCPDPRPEEIITPNGDGFNDVWVIANIQLYPDNKVSIFDRWGQRIYQKNGYTNTDAWDGKYLNVTLPVSAYYYVLQINTETDNPITFKGAVSILK